MVRRFNFPAQQLMLGGFDRFLADRSRQRAGKGDGGLPAKIGQAIDGVFLASRAVLTGEMARFSQVAQRISQFEIIHQAAMQQRVADLGKSHTGSNLL